MTTTKLPKKFKEKWLKALRSGEYEQGLGHLENDGGYCCLGVACVVAGYANKVKRLNDSWVRYGSYPKVPSILKNNSSALIGDSESEYNGQKIYTTLGEMNDNDGSFEEIANWIEKNL